MPPLLVVQSSKSTIIFQQAPPQGLQGFKIVDTSDREFRKAGGGLESINEWADLEPSAEPSPRVASQLSCHDMPMKGTLA